MLGTIIGLVPFLRRATHTTVEFLRPIPSVALIPLAVLMFGYQIQAALLIIVYASFWQVFIQVLYGVADVDAVARDTARSFGLSRGSRVVNLVFPTALPYLMTGLRLAAAVALILAITAEMFIGNPGLGREIVFAQSAGDWPAVYALVDRHRAARPAHQPRLPRDRAPDALVASVGARGGRAVTLYTSTVVTPRRPARVWAKIGENIALRDRPARSSSS